MRSPIVLIGVVFLVVPSFALAQGDKPNKPPRARDVVERYLHSGELAAGESALEARLATAPEDDEARFGLGIIQVVRGVERLGQALHKYGVKSENTHVPFLRLPVPKNAAPAPITYAIFRGILDDFRRDLATAEATLARITDDQVKLPLRLAPIRLDLTGSGTPTDSFMDILNKIMLRRDFAFLKGNPDFLVGFDRGDVAWLRAYAHLLMGMLDLYLAIDGERLFDLTADELFAAPKNRFTGDESARLRELVQARTVIDLKEPHRLGQFRRHMVAVARLNRETWMHIRAETDDDHEWLPNPRQHGVLGLPVRDGMIDVWLAMMAELEALFEGKRTIPKPFRSKDGKGLNLKVLLDDPPEKFMPNQDPAQSLPAKYWSAEPDLDIDVIFRVIQIFGDPSMVAYAMWFN
jgi:hypothetical protein